MYNSLRIEYLSKYNINFLTPSFSNLRILNSLYAFDLAKVILDILPKIKNNNVQIFHFSNNGQCSWLEFADLIFQLKNIKLKLIPIKTDEYPTIAKRPSYSVLDKTLIKNTFNLKIPNWEESLTNTINYL